jgi:hypothetical protein
MARARPRSYQYQSSSRASVPGSSTNGFAFINGSPDPVKGLDGFNTIEKLFDQIRGRSLAANIEFRSSTTDQFGYHTQRIWIPGVK